MAVERSEGTQMNLGRLGGERREGKGEEEREEREEKEEKEERLVNLDIFRVKIQSIFLITHSPILSIKMDNTLTYIYSITNVRTERVVVWCTFPTLYEMRAERTTPSAPVLTSLTVPSL